MAQWMPKLRDWDLSVWDEVRRKQAQLSLTTAGQDRTQKAVFRGGVNRPNVYSDRWRERGNGRTQVDAHNWRTLGRTALLQSKMNISSSSMVSINLGESFAHSKLAQALDIPDGVFRALDTPSQISMEQQQQKFAFVINAEGHGGWADRLYRLLLSSQLTLAQDLPHDLWYEAFTAPGVTHLSLDSNIDPANLSASVRLARADAVRTRQMVFSANAAMELATSTAGMTIYTSELLRGYGRMLRYTVKKDARAIQFSCKKVGAARQCQVPKSEELRKVRGIRCMFLAPDESGRMFDTLHEAAQHLDERETAKSHAGSDTEGGSRAPSTKADDQECERRCAPPHFLS